MIILIMPLVGALLRVCEGRVTVHKPPTQQTFRWKLDGRRQGERERDTHTFRRETLADQTYCQWMMTHIIGRYGGMGRIYIIQMRQNTKCLLRPDLQFLIHRFSQGLNLAANTKLASAFEYTLSAKGLWRNGIWQDMQNGDFVRWRCRRATPASHSSQPRIN